MAIMQLKTETPIPDNIIMTTEALVMLSVPSPRLVFVKPAIANGPHKGRNSAGM
jgi:hypothetical protein